MCMCSLLLRLRGRSTKRIAIEHPTMIATIHQLHQQFTLPRERKQNVVNFSDSMSVLQALENQKLDSSLIISIIKTLSAFMQ